MIIAKFYNSILSNDHTYYAKYLFIFSVRNIIQSFMSVSATKQKSIFDKQTFPSSMEKFNILPGNFILYHFIVKSQYKCRNYISKKRKGERERERGERQTDRDRDRDRDR